MNKPSTPVTDWKRKGLRVGWTIRNKNGQLCTVTWICNGQVTYKLKASQSTPSN